MSLELSPLDAAFGDLLQRRAQGGHGELLRHTGVVVSAERAAGNSCIVLEAWAGQPSPLDAAWSFPAVSAWREALRASGACDEADAPHGRLTPLVSHGTRIYLRRFFEAERRLATEIRRRVSATPLAAVDLSPQAALFRTLFPSAAQALDWQALAAAAALRSSLVFVTGGPGTGKTTVAARLLVMLLAQQPAARVALAAPTGRAAARLAEAIGAAVERDQLAQHVTTPIPQLGTTLHRLLGYQPWNDRFRYSASRPLTEDIVVVDEASMVDVLMMDALMAAVRPDARIIVLGDADQLASVDTGFVLGDVARAAATNAGAPLHEAQHSRALAEAYAVLSGGRATLVPHDDADVAASPLRDAVVRLRHSYRFGAQPGIGALATAAQAGDAPAALNVLESGAYADVSLRAGAPGIDALLTPLAPFIDNYLEADTPAAALEALARFRVLCALRDGDSGVTGLNAAIEQWLRQRGVPVSGWYDHRPVLITANDPGTRLFNGDVGTTLTVDGVTSVHFAMPGGGVRAIAPARLPAHETAWAMTVHKAQGSEFDHVLFVLPDSDARVLTRELLYTAVTRARRTVSVVGAPELVRRAVERRVERASGLVDQLR
jgi:exodeoxyribonuclease V alpha subunit